MRLVVLYIIVALLAATIFAASSCDFCKTGSGSNCNRNGYAAATAEATTQAINTEEEEVVLHYNGYYQYNINRPYECVSSCDWIRADKYVCDDCVYPFAFYNKTLGYQGKQCITNENKWSVMKEEPQKVESYVDACKSKGVCDCRKPPARCTISCSSFYDSVCQLQESSSRTSFFNIKTKTKPKDVAATFKKCADYQQSKSGSASSRSAGVFGGFSKRRATSQLLLKEYQAVNMTPFVLTEAASAVQLNFDIKELNYWCPSSGPVYSGKRFMSSLFRQVRSRKSKSAKYAPKNILEAIDSYCSYKIDKAANEHAEKFKKAQEERAKKLAQKAAEKAYKHAHASAKKANKAAEKAAAFAFKQATKASTKLLKNISVPQKPAATTPAQQLVLKALIKGKKKL